MGSEMCIRDRLKADQEGVDALAETVAGFSELIDGSATQDDLDAFTEDVWAAFEETDAVLAAEYERAAAAEADLQSQIDGFASVDDFAALSDEVVALSEAVSLKADQEGVDALTEQLAVLSDEVNASALQDDLDAFTEDVYAAFADTDTTISSLSESTASAPVSIHI